MYGKLEFTTIIDSKIFAFVYIPEVKHYLIFYEIGISYDNNGNKNYIFEALKDDNDVVYCFESLKDATNLLIKLGEYREKQKQSRKIRNSH